MANASDKKQVKVCVGIDDAGRKVMEEHPPLNIDPPKVLLQRLTGRDHTRPKETDPITGKKTYPAIPGRQPDPVYDQMLAAYRTSKGDPEAELVLSEKFVRDNLCGCMSQRESAKCADKKLFAFKEALETYHKLSSTRQHGGGDGTDCTSCGSARAKITAFCRGGVDAAVDAAVCTRARIPELDMPKLDPRTSMPTGVTDECDLPSFECCGGTCSDPNCGWNGVFGKLPEHKVVIGGAAASRTVTIRGCDSDFGDDKVVWNSWQKIANEPVAEVDPTDPNYDPTKKATFATYWHPTSGTMSEFMVYFHDVFIEYLAHHVWRKWHRLHQKRTIWKLIIEPAILRHLGKDVPEWQQGWCMSHTDFAATISSGNHLDQALSGSHWRIRRAHPVLHVGDHRPSCGRGYYNHGQAFSATPGPRKEWDLGVHSRHHGVRFRDGPGEEQPAALRDGDAPDLARPADRRGAGRFEA